jgi:hypothetical protein
MSFVTGENRLLRKLRVQRQLRHLTGLSVPVVNRSSGDALETEPMATHLSHRAEAPKARFEWPWVGVFGPYLRL